MEVSFLFLELQDRVQEYENYISAKGIDEQVIDAYLSACQVAFETEKNVEYGLKLTERLVNAPWVALVVEK